MRLSGIRVYILKRKSRLQEQPIYHFEALNNFSGATLAKDFPEMPDYEGIKKFKWGIRNIIANTMEGFDKDLNQIRKTI